jgi:hypothetical protein
LNVKLVGASRNQKVKEGAGSGFHQFANACQMKQIFFKVYIEGLKMKLKPLYPEFFLQVNFSARIVTADFIC